MKDDLPLETVLVERSFPEPVSFEEVQCKENKSAWCFQTYGVEFVQTYVSKDNRRMICVYRAVDAEAVRRANEQAGLPFDRVWSGTLHTAE